MTSLITILIALLGYGTPQDFEHLSEDQLNDGIATMELYHEEGGEIWDMPTAQ